MALTLTAVGQSPFAVVELHHEHKPVGEELSVFTVKAKPLKGICEYWQLLEIAEEKAKSLGANCIVVEEHLSPKGALGCHRIQVKALNIQEPEKFERRIEWHPNRLLTLDNFQGPIEQRPAQAGSATVFTYRYFTDPFFGKVHFEVLAYFYPQESYFKPQVDSVYILAHEQLHFDLTELYARKFFKAISTELDPEQDLNTQISYLYEKIQRAHRLRQDAFDAEVYASPDQHEKWREEVDRELAGMSAFAEKSGILFEKSE